MQEIATAYANVPEDHLALLIGMTAVIGGLILGGIGIWRGVSLQMKSIEVRAQLLNELVSAGFNSTEILAILDHSAISSMNHWQRRQLVDQPHRAPQKPAKPPAMART